MDVHRLEENIEAVANLLKALSNEKRLLIICALHKGEKSVGALEKIVGLSQSALSQHLARLRQDGIVETRRESQTIYYRLNHEATESVLQTLHDVCSEVLPDTESLGFARGRPGFDGSFDKKG